MQTGGDVCVRELWVTVSISDIHSDRHPAVALGTQTLAQVQTIVFVCLIYYVSGQKFDLYLYLYECICIHLLNRTYLPNKHYL